MKIDTMDHSYVDKMDKMDKMDKTDKTDKSDKSKDSKTFQERKTRFTIFNVALLVFTGVLGLLDYFLPTRKSPITKSFFIIQHILPMIYFIFFSFLFGAIFILGVVEVRSFVAYYLKDKLLDLGVIAAYFGVISIIISIFFKNIIEKSIGIKIKSKPVYDIIGFIIGRVILLTVIYLVERKRGNIA